MRYALLLPLAGLILAPTTDRRASFDFRYDVLPLLHRQGCGSAYCHGSATGRGGFKLSLFASDPAADYRAITADLGGRRLDLRAPEQSLLLRKPSLQTRHGGGRRLRIDDKVHRALADWVAAGAPWQRGPAIELIGLQLSRDGDQLRAVAAFRGGDGEQTRDVTDLCTFTSSDDRIAAVDATGRVVRKGKGEAFLFARYIGQSARLAWTEPFATAAVEAGAVTHRLDQLWRERLSELGLRPGPIAAPNVIARRLYLDLADRLPTPSELTAFAQLPAGTRVATTAAGLARDRAFAVKFGRLLARTLEIPLTEPARPNPRTAVYQAQHRKLVAAVDRGDTLHTIARRLLTEDRTLLNGSADPRDRAELTGRALLGVRIGCARCHNSPVDRWEQDEHLAFSALFASPRPKPGGGMRAGILFDPETGAQVAPRLLPVAARTDPPDAMSHAETVAWFVLRAGNGMFERNMANRVFAALLGRGLVEPLDDHRLSNPARHENVLAHLAEVAADGDLRKLVLHIVTSRLYQATSTRSTDADVRFFARRTAWPTEPVTFANAVASALGATMPAPLPASPLARQLALINSDFLHGAIAESQLLEGILQFAPDAATKLHDIYVLLLSRAPRAEEVTAFLPQLQRGAAGARDLAFALLAGREFGSIR